MDGREKKFYQITNELAAEGRVVIWRKFFLYHSLIKYLLGAALV